MILRLKHTRPKQEIKHTPTEIKSKTKTCDHIKNTTKRETSEIIRNHVTTHHGRKRDEKKRGGREDAENDRFTLHTSGLFRLAAASARSAGPGTTARLRACASLPSSLAPHAAAVATRRTGAPAHAFGLLDARAPAPRAPPPAPARRLGRTAGPSAVRHGDRWAAGRRLTASAPARRA